MIFFPVLLFGLWLEISGLAYINQLDVALPLTILVLLYLSYKRWIDGYQLLLLGAIFGYVLDLWAAPRAGWVLGAMAVSLGGWILYNRISHDRNYRFMGIIGAAAVYQLLISQSFGWNISLLVLIQIGWLGVIAMLGLWLMRGINRLLESRL